MLRIALASAATILVVGIVLGAMALPAVGLRPPAEPPVLGPVVAPDAVSWAYGAQKWFNVTAFMPNGVHVVRAYLAWYTIFTLTNTSANSTFLTVERVVVTSFTATYCVPNCTNPEVRVDLAHATWESVRGYLNLTNQAVVYESGVATPALGLLDSAGLASGAVNTTVHVAVRSAQGLRTTTAQFGATGAAALEVGFDPALGVLPLDLSTLAPGDGWNATSAYAGSGSWSVDWTYSKTNASGGTVTLSGHPSGTIASNGTVSVAGEVLGSTSLPGGPSLPSIALEWTGPFNATDGLVLLPGAYSLFGPSGPTWQGNRMGFAYMQTHRLVVALGATDRGFELRAASAFYGTDDDAMAWGDSGGMGPGGGMGPANVTSPAASGVALTEVSALPMGVAEATSASEEALSAVIHPGPTTTTGGAGEFPWFYLLLGAAVMVVVLAVALLRMRRRP